MPAIDNPVRRTDQLPDVGLTDFGDDSSRVRELCELTDRAVQLPDDRRGKSGRVLGNEGLDLGEALGG